MMVAARNRRPKRDTTQAAAMRWLPALLMLAILVALVGGAAGAYTYMSQPGRLPLRTVEVNGEFQRLRPAEIQQTVMAVIDGGFFSCDMQNLRSAVLAMPWVDEVSIRRIWPDKLSMAVTEKVPLARWGEDALISVNGDVFRPAGLHGYAGLVKLHGPQGSERRVVEFFAAAVPAARMRELQIAEVELDQRRHLWLRFDNGTTVSLGREDIEHRLAQFFRVYPSLVADPARQPERVDMRYAHGFAVRWREPANPQPGAAELNSQGKV